MAGSSTSAPLHPQIEDLRKITLGMDMSQVVSLVGTPHRVIQHGDVTGQVTGQVTRQVLSLLKVAQGERSRKELMEAMGLTGRDNFEKLYLHPALGAELIEMTIPDKPNSRLQKYRLTEKGKQLLEQKS